VPRRRQRRRQHHRPRNRGGIYLHAGPEIGVASTKAFTCQCVVLTMLALYLGRRRFMGQAQCQEIIDGLCAIPDQMERVLKLRATRSKTSPLNSANRENWLFLGRGYHYPVALEGALKLKEISYIHAEGMPAAEMKHGPIALITKDMPVVFVATKGVQYDKVISNIEEVRARGGKVIAVATEGDTQMPLQRARRLRPRRDGMPPAAADGGAAAIAGVSRRRCARLQRG
jgi:glutamine---fructose-6-phosphate transaminase (isomerizing)